MTTNPEASYQSQYGAATRAEVEQCPRCGKPGAACDVAELCRPELDLDAMPLDELGSLKRTMSSMLTGHRYGAGHSCTDACKGREESYRVVAKAYYARLTKALAEKTDLSGWKPYDESRWAEPVRELDDIDSSDLDSELWEPSYGEDYDGADDARGE